MHVSLSYDPTFQFKKSFKMQLKQVRMLRLASVLVGLFAFTTGRCLGEGMDYPLAVVAGPDHSIYVADRNLPGI